MWWRFEPVGRLHAGRISHTATGLDDGRVLIVGGESSPRSAEIYDPETRSFTPIRAGVGQGDHRAVCTGLACFADLEAVPTCRPDKPNIPRGCSEEPPNP